MSAILARKGAGVFLSNWVVLPFQFLTGILVVRILGAEGKGMLAVLFAGLALLTGLGQFGLPNAATYLMRQGRAGERDLLLHFAIVAGAFTAAIAAAVLLLGDRFWGIFFDEQTGGIPIIAASLCALPLMMTSSFLGNLLLARGSARAYTRQVVGFGVVSLFTTLAFVVALRWGVLGGMIALGLSHLVVAAVSLLAVLKATPGARVRWQTDLMREMIRLGLQNYLSTIGTLLFKRVDTFLIQGLLGTSAVGYYSVARVPFDSLLTIPRAVNGLLAGEASGGDRAAAGAIVARVVRNVLWIMAGIVVPIALAAPWAVPILYGADFAVSVPPLLVLLGAAVLMGGASSLQTYFVGVGEPGINARATLISGALSTAASVLLLPVLGILGNALAVLLGVGVLFAFQMTAFITSSRCPWRDVLHPDREAWRTLVKQVRARMPGTSA